MKRFLLAAVLVSLWSGSLSSAPSERVESSLRVTVDPRMELLAVVQLLSGYEKSHHLITRFDFPYKRAVAEYFSPYKDHRAVTLFATMSAKGFSYDAPPAVMLYLSDPPELRVERPFTNYLEMRAGGEEKLGKFLAALRDFARETKFMEFFKEHGGFYSQVVSGVKGLLGDLDVVGVLERYFGMELTQSYTVILVPLFQGNYGPRVGQADGTDAFYSICGNHGVSAVGHPLFGSAEGFRHLLWHEFGHSFINPLVEKHREQLAQYASLHKPIAEAMKQQAYGDWETCVKEHIVRAVTVRLTIRTRGPLVAAGALLSERMLGFAYIGPLCRRLGEYETQRDKYPTFADFCPRLIDVFRELAEKEPVEGPVVVPSLANINAIVMDTPNAVIIVPTHETDVAVQQRIHAYARMIRDRFFVGRPIITDQEALQRDLSSNSLIVYGSPTGNLWLAKHLPQLPVRIEAERILADAEYQGTNLRFITAWPNPQNPKKGVVMYTAQRAEDVLDINAVFHGPTDYVVARDEEVLQAGYYVKTDGRWNFEQTAVIE